MVVDAEILLPRLLGGVVGRVEFGQGLLVRDGPDPAQDVGGVVGVVLPHGLAVHHRTGEATVVEQGDELRRYVLRQEVGHRGGVPLQRAQAQLIEDPQHHPGLRLRKVLRDAELPAHQPHQVLRRQAGGGGQLERLHQLPAHQGQLGLLRDLRRGPVSVPQEVLEPEPLGAPRLLEGVGVRPALGHGQPVLPDDALLPEQLQKPQHGPGHALGVDRVPLRGDEVRLVRHQVRIEAHGIDLPVGDQHLPVPVRDLSPEGLHLLGGGDLGGGFGPVVRPVDDLGVVEDAHEKDQADDIGGDQKVGPSEEVFFVFQE